MTMERRRLAKIVSEETGCTITLAYKAVDSLFESLRDSLLRGERVEIRGFGTLDVKHTKGKPGARNLRTNEMTPVPPHRLARFRAGRILREAMRQEVKGVE